MLTVPWNVPLGTENVTGPCGESAQPSSTVTPAVPPMTLSVPLVPPPPPELLPALRVPDAPPLAVVPLTPLPPVAFAPPLAAAPPLALEPAEPPLEGAFPAPPLPGLAPVPDGVDPLLEQASENHPGSAQATSQSATNERRIDDRLA